MDVMIRPRWRKVLRDLWGNKARTILVVLSIAVGVFAVGAISSSQVILGRDLGITYDATNPPSALISTDPFDDDLLTVVRNMPEVRAAEGRRILSTRVKIGPDQWRDLFIFTVPDDGRQQVDIINPQAGAWPPPREQILIERASIGLLNAQIGDTLLIETAAGKQRELKIAGTAHHLLRPPAQFTGIASAYVTFDTLEWLGEPRDYNQLRFIVAERDRDKEHITAVAGLVRDKIEKGGRTVYSTFVPTPGKHPADDAVQPILLVLSVMGYLSLVLSGFLVINIIGAVLAQHVRQIGMMKAVGARTGQVMSLYFAMVLAFGVLALLVAVPLGAVGAWAFTAYIAGIINFDVIDYSIPREVLLMEIAIGMLVPVAAALVPIIAGARVTVREAISSHGIREQRTKNRGQTNKEQVMLHTRAVPGSLFSILCSWFSVPGSLFSVLNRPLLLSLRNTFRRRGRVALTLFTLTLGGAIFIGVFSVRESLLRTLDEALSYRGYTVEVAFSRSYRVEQIEREALRVPGVTQSEALAVAAARRIRADDSESDTILVHAPPAATTMLRPKLLEGRWLLPGDENALVVNSDLLKDETDVQVGDTITLKIDGRERDWQVVGVVQGVLAGPFAYANYPYFARAVREVDRASRVLVVGSAADHTAQINLATALERHFEEIGLNVASTETRLQALEGVEAQFAVLVVFLLIMAVLIAVVGALGLMGTMSINVLERTREIGVMRAIGASDGSVLQIVIVEGVIIGLLSWLTATVLALPLSRLLSDAVGNAFLRAPLDYIFSLSGVLMWLAAAVVLAAVASFLPARSASRLSVREVLAYE